PDTPETPTTPDSPGTPNTPQETEPAPATMYFSVGKVWSDDNNQSGERPESVSVQLYRDGTAYGAPVTLSAANEWWYRWNDLPVGSVWTVDEVSVPEGYTKSFTKNADNAVVIVNTYQKAETAPAQEHTPDTPAHSAATGDGSRMEVWMIVLMAAAAALIVCAAYYVFVVRRRRK
ncbi:MAG: Cna B-type domain-containing protein, partial [Eubacteriales bacterium]|nr:Cna B-type domain-containing protein [Eubacteriales bacterium]